MKLLTLSEISKLANPSKLEALRREYQLTEKQKENIGRIIIDHFTFHVDSVDKPTAIILGGQPGAGKGELTNVALSMLKYNVVICNADDYRDYHPKAEEIKRLHEEHYPAITVEYSQPWNNILKEHCISNRFNFILETTFSSGEKMNSTIEDLKKSGYSVYLMVIAVNAKLSYLGTKMRYEEMRATSGYGRLVDKEVHDQKYDHVSSTLEIATTKKLYDKLFIYGRAGGQNIKGKRQGLVLLSENSEHAFEDYIKERDREWTDNDMRYFNNDLLYLLRRMVERRAKYEEMAEIFDVFEVGLPPKA